MKELEATSLQNLAGTHGILFWAPWAEPSQLVEQLLDDQATEFPQINFGKINVDEHAELVELFQVESVSTLIFLRNGKIANKYTGSDPMAVLQLTQEVASAPEELPLEDRLKALINRHPFMIFIKGTPSGPRCGFTATLLRQLNQLGVDFDHFDILSDDEIRQGLKQYSNWPTFPQIYVNGELLGGLDIFMDMLNSGELQDVLDTLKA